MAKYIPKEGNFLTITLPGEILRAIVIRVVNNDTVIVEVASEPLSKTHTYRFRDVVVCKRRTNIFGEDWEVKEVARTSVEEIIEQENKDAVTERRKPKNNIKKHTGAKKRKLSTKSSGSNKPKRSKKVSKKS